MDQRMLMVVVARDQAEAKQSDIIASKRVIRSHRSKLAFVIDLVDTAATIVNTSSTAITFAFVVVASCKLIVAQVSFVTSTSTMQGTLAVVNTVAANFVMSMDLLEPLWRCYHPYPYFSSQSLSKPFRLDSLLFL